MSRKKRLYGAKTPIPKRRSPSSPSDPDKMLVSLDGREKITNEQIIEALNASGGILTGAAQFLQKKYACKIPRQFLQNKIKRDKELTEAYEETRQVMIDVAENQLHQQIRAGVLTAVMFYLKCMAKDRGYVDRQQLQPVMEQPKDVVILELPDNGRN